MMTMALLDMVGEGEVNDPRAMSARRDALNTVFAARDADEFSWVLV
jgi:hypothetical protein